MCFDYMPLFEGPHVIQETTHFLFSSLIISTKVTQVDRSTSDLLLRKQVNMKGHETERQVVLNFN